MVVVRVRKRTGGFLLGFLLFLLGAALFGYFGYHMLSGNLEMIRNGETASATVVEMAKHTGSKSVTYNPVLVYTTASGETVRTEYSSGSSNAKAFQVGQTVTVYYSRSDPREILIDRFLDKYGFPVVFVFAGVVSFTGAIVILFRKLKYGAA
jgi:hypothetical protein